MAQDLSADLELVEAAKRKAGGNARLAAIFGVDESAASRWGRQRAVPRHLRPRLEAYVATAGGLVREPAIEYPHSPEYVGKEWRETHSFTAMVEALRRLERIRPDSLQAWRARVAWETVIRAADVVLKIADWKDRDWEDVYRKGLDHWLRPRFGRRSEQQTLRERLQIELGFGEGEQRL